jgi:hypothetical protein
MLRKMLFFVGLLFLLPTVVWGAALQNSTPGFATSINLNQSNVKVGSIVIATTSGHKLSSTEYDASIFGVVTNSAAIALEESSGSAYLVTSSGSTLVRVTAKNGAIKKSDWITTSKIPGVGMKALRSGYVLGSALGEFNPKNKDQEGLILVSLAPRYVASKGAFAANLFNIFSLSTLATYEEPLTVFKYFIAAALVVISVVAGFLIFGRISALGIQALGRNPLASHKIQWAIVLNVLITITIIVVGLVLSLTIIK